MYDIKDCQSINSINKNTLALSVHRKPTIHLKISRKRISVTTGLIYIKRKQCGNRRHLVSYTLKTCGELSTVTMDT